MEKCMTQATRNISKRTRFSTSKLVTIYSGRYFGANGRIYQDHIEFSAVRPGAYYREYPYFLWGTFLRPEQANAFRVTVERPPLECLCRARRVALFADVTDLEPRWSGETLSYFEHHLREVHIDHRSVWRNASGASFLLNEPYVYKSLNEVRNLMDGELAVTEVPVPLAPYGGVWSPTPGDWPRSRSFLFARREDEAELLEISYRLQQAAHGALAWNDTTGVRCGGPFTPTPHHRLAGRE